MECEMCGKEVGTRRYMVDGTTMNLGMCCSKYGQEIATGIAPVGTKASMEQSLHRRAGRSQSKDVYQGETLDFVEDFGTRIRVAREKKGWTYEQLGNKVSARVPQLRQIESGHLRPSDELGKKLERDLGITIMEKMDGPAAVGGVTKARPKAGLTIGDILKDAMGKN
jgi:putative transcription factor